MISGRRMPVETVERIRKLLAETEMQIADIAARMGCSRSAVKSLNDRFGIRDYGGSRVRWTLLGRPKN